ncbi:MAG: hypothetical protein AB9836_04855 [Aminipila sp.]
MNNTKRAIEFMQFSIEIQLTSTRAMIHCNGRKKLGKKYLKEMGQRIANYKTAIIALQEKTDRENPKPLTKDKVTYIPSGKYCWLADKENKKYYPVKIFDSGTGWVAVVYFGNDAEEYFTIENYGKTWELYDHKPKEDKNGAD